MIWRFLPWAVLAVWFLFVGVFLISHPKRLLVDEVKRARGWWAGFALQVLAFVMVWGLARPFGTPIGHYHMPIWLEFSLAGSAIVIAVLSAWLVIDAIRALGKQFAVAARVISGHELIITGPFQVVRHPIYSGMLGLLVATGIAFSTWLGLILSIAVYLAGTTIRIRREESLLRETFGAEFEEYAREVPALVPGLF